jgi:hypothetical protein
MSRRNLVLTSLTAPRLYYAVMSLHRSDALKIAAMNSPLTAPKHPSRGLPYWAALRRAKESACFYDLSTNGTRTHVAEFY